MSQNMEKILAMYNRDYLDAKDSNAPAIMQAISKIKDPLTKIKMIQSLAPTMFAMSGGHPLLNKVSAIAMGSNAITGDNYLKRMDQQAQQKVINRLERQVGYNNAAGDTAYRTMTGINNLGMSIGVAGSVAKGLGQAGVIPNFMGGINPLVLMGAMQGGKGLGTMAAGGAGGMAGLGTALGAGGTGMMGMMNPAMLGVMAMMAMNMGGSKITDMMLHAGSTNTKRFRASVNLHLSNGSQLELEYSSMVQISSQIKMMANMNLLTPSETLQANILMMIESHTSVLAPMLAEIKNATEHKNKSGANAGQNVASELFGEDGLLALQNQKGTKKTPNFIQRGAKHFAQFATNLNSVVDVFGQIGNTLSGKSSSQLFNEANRQKHTKDATQEFSDKFGIATSMVTAIHTSSAEVLSKADTYEAKHISILAGIYELNRYQSHELLSIRRDGMGVERPGHTGELARMRIQEEADDGEIETFGKMVDEMLGYIPLWHTISGTAKMVMAGYDNVKELVTKKVNPFTSMMGELGKMITKTFASIDTDAGSLRNTIGATKLAPAELMARYLSGDYIKQMSDLVNYNRESAYYLKYLAGRESAKTGRADRQLQDYKAEEALQMDEFSGKLLNQQQMIKRNNTIGKKLSQALTGVVPDGIMGMMANSFFGDIGSKKRVEAYAINNFEHIKELHKQFGGTDAYRNRRGFDEGGNTGPGEGKPNKKGNKVAGEVHDNEYVIPKWYVKQNQSLIGSLEQDRKNRTNKTSEMLADAAHTKEAQAQEAEDVAKQTDLQTSMFKVLKQIAEYTGLMANPKKEAHKPGDWSLGDLASILALAGAAAMIVTQWKDIKKMVADHGAILAAVAASLGIPLIQKLSQKYLPGLPKVWGETKNIASKTWTGTKNLVSGAKEMSGGKFLEGAKNFAKNAGNNLLANTEQVTAKSVLAGGGKFLAKSAPMVMLLGAFDYFTQDDKNDDGSQKDVGDKLKHTAEYLLSQTGMLVGSTIGGALGSRLGRPGMIVGAIAGGLLGEKIQKDTLEWWSTYGHESGSDKPLTFMEKGTKFLESNLGATIGSGIGMVIGGRFGKYGAMVGGIAGGFLGEKIQDNITKVLEGFSNLTDGTGTGEAAKAGAELIAMSVAAKAGSRIGMAVGAPFGPIGMILGSLVGYFLADGLISLGDGIVNKLRPSSNAIPQTKDEYSDAERSRLNNKIKKLEGIDPAKLTDNSKKELVSAKADLKLLDQGYVGAHSDSFFTNKIVGKDGKEILGDSWALDRLIKMKFTETQAKQMISTSKEAGMSPALLLSITSQEASGNTKAINKNKNGTTDYGMYQFNNGARLNSLSKRPELAEDLKRLGINPGDGDALGQKMLGDPVLQTKVLALDFKISKKTGKQYINAYNPNDIRGTNQKTWNLDQASIHYGTFVPTTPTSTPVPSTDTSTGKAAAEMDKTAAAEQAKKQTAIQKKADEQTITVKEHTDALNSMSAKLSVANAHLSEMSANQSALVAAADKASTLWKYIETVYSAPKFNDAQFSAITIR